MATWLRARLSEPSTYAGLGGACLAAAFLVITTWPYWRYLAIAGGIFFMISAIKQERARHG